MRRRADNRAPGRDTVTIGRTSSGTVVIKVGPRRLPTVLRLSLAAPNGGPLPRTEARSPRCHPFRTTAMIIVAIAIAGSW